MGETVQSTDTSWIELDEAIKALHPRPGAEVKELTEKARGYVWGWEDAGGAKRTDSDSWHFPVAYGWHCYKYATGRAGTRHPIRDCFAMYLRGEDF